MIQKLTTKRKWDEKRKNANDANENSKNKMTQKKNVENIMTKENGKTKMIQS